MKITFCSYDSPWIHGGPMSWSTRFLPALRDLGYEIEIIFFTEGDLDKCKFIKFFKEEGFKMHFYPYVSFSYLKIRWILKTLNNNRPDIFIANDYVHAYYACKWVKKAGIPSIGILHSDDEFHYGVIDEFVNGREEFRLSAVVSVSKLLLEKVNSLQTGINSVYIPYGAPTEIVKDWKTSAGKTRLVYIGRLSEWQKRISETTHALCKAAKEIDGLEVNIFGGGETEKVKSIISEYELWDKVKLRGLIASDEVQKEMINHDIFVLLSDFEGLPIALMEAMACGLVPVCKNIESGIPELITNGETGFLVEDRDKDFINTIRKLHDNRSLLSNIGSNARTKILREYSTTYSVKIWHKLFQELKSGSSNRNKIKIPAFFVLPKKNSKLNREDFRLTYLHDECTRFILSPFNKKMKQVIRPIIIKLGLGKYLLKVY